MDKRIQAANEAHIPIIRAIAHETWPPTFGSILSPEQIAYMLNWMYSEAALREQMQRGHRFLLGYEGEQPLGYASFEMGNPDALSVKIHKLYVLPQAQGKGMGQALIAFIEKEALEVHKNRLLLNVNRFNKAVDFYQKNGFNILKEEDIEIGKGFLMEDFVMEKSLRACLKI